MWVSISCIKYQGILFDQSKQHCEIVQITQQEDHRVLIGNAVPITISSCHVQFVYICLRRAISTVYYWFKRIGYIYIAIISFLVHRDKKNRRRINVGLNVSLKKKIRLDGYMRSQESLQERTYMLCSVGCTVVLAFSIGLNKMHIVYYYTENML